MVVRATVAATAPARITMTTITSCTLTAVRGTNSVGAASASIAPPPRTTAVTTIAITYERSDALCRGGAMTRPTASSAAMVPV
ncbi:hypothetical protein D3C83_01790 [compost metagenome]